jgi:L-amino acid N-acyltransferase YncA
MMSDTSVRVVSKDDAMEISEIYNYYILNTHITFEENVVSEKEMENRISEIQEAGLPWLVAIEAGRVVGYAYASKWKGRCAYRFSVESTVYLAPGHSGNGIGSLLYEALMRELRESGFHVVIGGIALPNPASVALHEKFGMKQVAHFKEVGFKFGKWIDVGYWQAILAS